MMHGQKNIKLTSQALKISSAFGKCLQMLVKLQIINIMKILVAVMQLLSEDVRTDRQTDKGNLNYAPFKLS
jgi:hypothetical protein